MVELSDAANGNLNADAIRIERLEQVPEIQVPEIQVLDGTTDLGDGTGRRATRVRSLQLLARVRLPAARALRRRADPAADDERSHERRARCRHGDEPPAHARG